MKTIVYIDGFNLYYGSLKRTPYKWLDVSKLCSLLLPSNQIEQIKYFTASVSARKDNPDQPLRQNIYFRALNTIPNLVIIKGHFLTHKRNMPIANDFNCPKFRRFLRKLSLPIWYPIVRYSRKWKMLFAKVVRTDEKGSDVNLATHLLHDAYRNRFEVAVLISGDGDLREAVRIVRREIGKTVGVINPQKHPCAVLLNEATFYQQIRPSVLAASQFPDTLSDAHGTFHKPDRWKI